MVSIPIPLLIGICFSYLRYLIFQKICNWLINITVDGSSAAHTSLPSPLDYNKKTHTYNSYNIDTLGKANGSKTGIQTYIH